MIDYNFRLFRAEAANANKGFLLNSYKSQLAELTNEKEVLSSRIKDLENENSSLRNNNAQLRAKVSISNDEKEKLATKSEKSEIEIREQVSVIESLPRLWILFIHLFFFVLCNYQSF